MKESMEGKDGRRHEIDGLGHTMEEEEGKELGLRFFFIV
ncbi:hypothetical protein A2U01_0073792 [Trifolium medium]|uniref:Uncharacterized protein n=1 Tax=Trifolium medium TaxID=97028 RepID=A0A392SVT0_9FABA|nr:hypothetical protein [Trifolium medium]